MKKVYLLSDLFHFFSNTKTPWKQYTLTSVFFSPRPLVTSENEFLSLKFIIYLNTRKIYFNAKESFYKLVTSLKGFICIDIDSFLNYFEILESTKENIFE